MGALVGDLVGLGEGSKVGAFVGFPVGPGDGIDDGNIVGETVGFPLGFHDGFIETDGAFDAIAVGVSVGEDVGGAVMCLPPPQLQHAS